MADALALRNVTKHYSNGRGISEVTLSVKAGEIFGFLGPNGAGKTTTIRCIMNFIRPQNGQISLLGKDVARHADGLHANIGYIPADTQLYPNWTGQQHVDFYQAIRSKADVSNIVTELELPMGVKFHQLSTGNKQKLAILLAFIGNPKLLIMDEPTKGLDPLLQQKIYELLRHYRANGGTAFVSSHNLPEVEKICDRVGVIKEGRIVADESMQHLRSLSVHLVTIVTSKAIPSALLPKSAEVVHHSGGHILLKVRGDLNPLLAVLAKHPVKDLEVTHANLEETFMEYYK